MAVSAVSASPTAVGLYQSYWEIVGLRGHGSQLLDAERAAARAAGNTTCIKNYSTHRVSSYLRTCKKELPVAGWCISFLCTAPVMSIGIPIKLLHEAEGHIVTLETTTGDVYRGKLLEAEDNMNCQMQNITVTARDGRVTQVEQVFIRGSMIRFLILPDMLKNAPMFKPKSSGSRGVSAGGGKSAMLRAQGRLYLQ